jgi:Flp pilus assembly protein TadD
MLEVRLLLTLRRLQEALDAADSALTLGPDRPELVYQRGAVLVALQRHAEAERDFRRALELAPTYVPALNDLGVLLTLRGNPDEAEALFRRALAVNPGDPLAKAGLDRLRDLPQPEPPRLPGGQPRQP